MKGYNIIDKTAIIGQNCKMGVFTVISKDVKIGEGCIIGNHVVIHEGTILGKGVKIHDNALIGKQPMKAANSAVTKAGNQPPAQIGDGCIIGTSAVIYAGARLGQKVFIADLATLREEVVIGDYTIIGRAVAIEPFTQIGSYCKIETNAYITAYSCLEDYVFVGPGVITSNDNFAGRTKERFKHYKGVVIKKGGRIGINCTILPGKVIGEDALVAAGSLVTKDIPPRKIAMGQPAKVVKDVPREQLLENQ